MAEGKLLYGGNSLEIYLKIKSELNNHGIVHGNSNKLNYHLSRIRDLLSSVGRAIWGTPDDYEQIHHIFVSEADYDDAKKLAKKFL